MINCLSVKNVTVRDDRRASVPRTTWKDIKRVYTRSCPQTLLIRASNAEAVTAQNEIKFGLAWIISARMEDVFIKMKILIIWSRC